MTDAPFYDRDGITIYNGDWRDVVPELPQVDLVLTDPPYGINACKQTLGDGKKNFVRGDWDRERADGVPSLIDAGRFVCIWGGNYFADVLPVTNDWLVWHKNISGTSFSEAELAWTNYGRQARHLTHHWSGELKRHPTQKPLPVIAWALQLAPEGVQTVLDPFMGSGTTLVAAKLAGLRAIGIEKERAYCEVAAERLAQRVLFTAEDTADAET